MRTFAEWYAGKRAKTDVDLTRLMIEGWLDREHRLTFQGMQILRAVQAQQGNLTKVAR